MLWQMWDTAGMPTGSPHGCKSALMSFMEQLMSVTALLSFTALLILYHCTAVVHSTAGGGCKQCAQQVHPDDPE